MTILELPTTSYVVLGLLTFGRMSGYDIGSLSDASVAHFWPISRSQIYKALLQLEEGGLVEATEVRQERYPDKRVYELTPTGREAFDDWVREAELPEAFCRLPFLLRVYFGAHLEPAELHRRIAAERAEHEAELGHWQEVVDSLATEPALRHMRAAAMYGLYYFRGYIDWLDALEGEIEGGGSDATVRKNSKEGKGRE